MGANGRRIALEKYSMEMQVRRLGVYAWVLRIVMRQRHVYMDLLFQLLPRREPRQQGDVEHVVTLP